MKTPTLALSLSLVACSGADGAPAGPGADAVGDSGAGGQVHGDSGADARAHTVVASAVGQGAITPTGTLTVDAGEVLRFDLDPDAGHALVSMGGTCRGRLDGLRYTTEPVQGDCSVAAVFEPEAAEPAPYCTGTPPELEGLVVCDPDQTLDDWSEGRSYWTTELRIPAGTILALPFTANAAGRWGTLEMTNNMPGLTASGLLWHGWFSVLPGGAVVEDTTSCRRYSPNPNPLQIKWNQMDPADDGCPLGTEERTLYYNMEVRCFEELSDLCTPGERYADDYYLGVAASVRD